MMRKLATLLIFSLAACSFGTTQISQTSTPQTARQALDGDVFDRMALGPS